MQAAPEFLVETLLKASGQEGLTAQDANWGRFVQPEVLKSVCISSGLETVGCPIPHWLSYAFSRLTSPPIHFQGRTTFAHPGDKATDEIRVLVRTAKYLSWQTRGRSSRFHFQLQGKKSAHFYLKPDERLGFWECWLKAWIAQMYAHRFGQAPAFLSDTQTDKMYVGFCVCVNAVAEACMQFFSVCSDHSKKTKSLSISRCD